jgi:hypothetical protein
MRARQASNAGSVCWFCRLDSVHSTTSAGYNNTSTAHAIEGETSWRAVLVHWHDLEHLKAAQIT